jgi:hypothetical protein
MAVAPRCTKVFFNIRKGDPFNLVTTKATQRTWVAFVWLMVIQQLVIIALIVVSG